MTTPDLIRVERMGSMPWGTFGTMYLPDGTHFRTVEPTWQYNAKGKSCIPAGDYVMELRRSPIVERTSRGDYKHGWEIKPVPNRTLIMIHPGNWADGPDGSSDTNGCILVGRAHAVISGKPGVSASKAAFSDLMKRLAKRETWNISIRWIQPE